MRVALVFGGNTLEAKVSLMSKDDIIDAILSLGHEVFPVEFSENVAIDLQKINPDIVFNGMYGEYGEDGKLPGLLDIIGFNYTHSGCLQSAVAFNKKISYQFMDFATIKHPNFISCQKEDVVNGNWKKMVLENEYLKNKEDFFIKPNEDGSSFDSFKANFDSDFSNFKFQTKSKEILVQEFIKGREVFCAVLNDKSIGYIGVKHDGDFYDFDSKYFTGSHEKLNLESKIEDKIIYYSELLHKKIGLNCLSRSDFIIDDFGDIYMLEINSHPGMTKASFVPDIAKNFGLSYKELIKIILDNPNEKNQSKQHQ